MGSNEIFDLKNTDDLPKELKIIGRSNRFGENTNKILNLFYIKEELTINEIIVGFYRKYNKVIDRNFLSKTLFNLCKRKQLKKSSTRGVYKKYE